MIAVAEARAFVLAHCRPLAARRVALDESVGLVLAEDVTAPHALPSFRSSAMDGYALRAADAREPRTRLRVVGAVPAGTSTGLVVGEGEAARVMTGAPIPPGADAVCTLERTQVDTDGSVVVAGGIAAGANLREVGEEIAIGARVAASGSVLTSAHIGILAGFGVSSILVHPRPLVGVLSTGNEVVSGDGPPAAGQVRDSNRPALAAALALDGFARVDLGTVGDDERVIAAAVAEAAGRCDAVVASGGVSVGDRDHARAVLQRLCGETMRWMQLAVKPGKPFAFGVIAGARVPVFWLPGSPLGALTSYELLARPGLRAMSASPTLDRLRLWGAAREAFDRGSDGRMHLVRVIATVADDGVVGVVRASRASGRLGEAADGNAIALVPDGSGIPAGAAVELLVLDPDLLGRTRQNDWQW